MRVLITIFSAVFFLISQTAYAQDDSNQPKKVKKPVLSTYEKNKIKANKDTIGLAAGPVTGTFVHIAADIMDVMDGEDMKIFPIITKGSTSNIQHLLYLKGIDIALTQSDVMAYLNVTNENNQALDNIRYICKLYNQETHLLAKKEIKSINDLNDRKVSFDRLGSGSFVTASTTFAQLKIKPQIVNYDRAIALEKLKSGEIDAMLVSVGKPSELFAKIPKDANLHLLQIPYNLALHDTYLPAIFTSKDYPNLIAEGEQIQTVATSAVLAVYNWKENSDKYERLKRFTKALFLKFPEFHKPGRQEKWKELSLNAKLPGWKRFSPAEELIEEYQKRTKISDDNKGKNPSKSTEQNKAGDNQNAIPEQTADNRNKLFEEFDAWMKKNKKN